MQLFYSSALQANQESFTFDREESKHIVKVLRKKQGDILHLTNGLGDLFHCTISFASEKNCMVTLDSFQKFEAPKHYIHLAVAPTKMNERYEWFLEKATEMGIQEITPIICEHSERKIIKTERLEKIILSAMKQSNQFFLPKLNQPIAFKTLIESYKNQPNCFIAHCEALEKKSLNDCVEKNQKYLLLIGPEGDFSSAEIQLALEHHFKPVTLGNTRLRTETAAIVGCHTLVLKNS